MPADEPMGETNAGTIPKNNPVSTDAIVVYGYLKALQI
jgi:hypothetical protein